RESEGGRNFIRNVFEESVQIMRVLGAPVKENIAEEHMKTIDKISYDMKSSMQRDMEKGSFIEGKHLQGYLLDVAEQKAAKAKAQEYMAAVIRTLTPLMTKTQSQKKLQSLLTAGKNKRYYTETEGALRYVVADNGEKGLTFAVEPIKLALSESLEGLNK
ncbi:DUF1454 family protein, partial [Escherichia sp. TWPC-MK]